MKLLLIPLSQVFTPEKVDHRVQIAVRNFALTKDSETHTFFNSNETEKFKRNKDQRLGVGFRKKMKLNKTSINTLVTFTDK